MESLKEILIHI